jgi:hypothetical protein
MSRNEREKWEKRVPVAGDGVEAANWAGRNGRRALGTVSNDK